MKTDIDIYMLTNMNHNASIMLTTINLIAVANQSTTYGHNRSPQ